MKLYSPIEVFEEIKKALHKCIAKADPALQAVLNDLEDNDAVAEVPPDAIPKSPKNVLNKAAPGQPPKMAPKDAVMPNLPKPEMPKQPAMPKPPGPPKPKLSRPAAMGKAESPLKVFLENRKIKK